MLFLSPSKLRRSSISVLFGIRSTRGQLVRRAVAVGVLFGVLVAPLEASLPDVHDVTPLSVAAAVAVTHESGSDAPVASATLDTATRESKGSTGRRSHDGVVSFASHVEAQHACNSGANPVANPDANPDGCPQGPSHNTGYDHCAHSHVAHVLHATAKSAASAVNYAVYSQPARVPASFRAAPDIRPPIARA